MAKIIEQSHHPRVAFVNDALPFIGGAERVLDTALKLFPQAPVFTLVYNRDAFLGSSLAQRTVYTSFIDHLPYAKTKHRRYIPLYPLAVESFDLREYDLIISFSYAVAHGVLARPEQLHLSYLFTPLRYAWHYYQTFLTESGFQRGAKSWIVKALLHYLRLWDRAAADRVDRYAAVSKCVEQRIWRAYRRRAEIIYPPVEVERFQAWPQREDYYMVLSRLESHKKISLVVEAFSRLGLPLIVVGDGSEYERLSRLAAPNVRLLGWQPDETVEQLLGKAKAIVHAAEEDFGIALVEAQAAGCPVIAYGQGGARETVIPGVTGILFEEQSVDCLIQCVEAFHREPAAFATSDLQSNAARFSKDRFQQNFARFISQAWEDFGCEEGFWTESAPEIYDLKAA